MTPGQFWRAFRPTLTVSALVIGSGCILLGLVLSVAIFWSRPHGPRVVHLAGSVVRFERHMHARYARGFIEIPVVRYAVDGQAREFKARLGTDPMPWKIGEAVDVLYDPDTRRAELVGWKVWIPSVEYLLAAAICLSIGLALRRRPAG